MFEVSVTSREGSTEVVRVGASRCVLGSGSGSQVVLGGWKVHKAHAEVFVSNEQIFVRDLGSMFGTFVDGKKVATHGPLKPEERLQIASYTIGVAWSRPSVGDAVDAPGLARPTPPVNRSGNPPSAERSGEVAARPAPVEGAGKDTVKSTPKDTPSPEISIAKEAPSGGHHFVYDEELLTLRRQIQEKIILAFDMRRTDVHKMRDVELKELTERAIREIIAELGDKIPARIDKDRLLIDARDEAIGLGLLEPLLLDPSITEIMVNSIDEIFVERQGRLTRLNQTFSSEKAVMGIIERIVAPVGRRIDESSPLVDARLKDGSRFNAIIPPLALKGPSMTIRKFAREKLNGSDLVRFNSASPDMVDFLRLAVERKKNVIVSGGTGSGKTTLLNILSNFIPDGERIVTIEDAAELQLRHEHLVSLESRPTNAEGKGGVSIRDLVKNSLRMRPDRIVVGECRGGEALDMLQAMNTGHDGSLTTAHANTPRDMLARLEVMVLMSGMDLPIVAIREQVASAVDIIVQQTRFACGSRKITKVTEVTGVESGKIQLQDLFEFVETGVDERHKVAGFFSGCDSVPEFYTKLQSIGVDLDLSVFKRVRV